MRRRLGTVLSLGILFAVGTGTASAQYGPYIQSPYGPLYRPGGLYPAGTPPLSPYLDLTRGGNLAANYFLGTIPEIQRRQNTALFGAAIQDLERRAPVTETPADDLVPTLPGTGHPVAFQSYYPYYLLGARPGQPGRQQQNTSSARPR
jgi:hypothetical protein